VGGLFEFLYILGFCLTAPFTSLKFLSLAANRMYTWELSNNPGTTLKPVQGTILTEIPLQVPSMLGLFTFFHNFCCCGKNCCFRQNKWRNYESALKKVKYDLDGSLDMTLLLRRLRMHGLGLNFLMSKTYQGSLAEISEYKPIRYLTDEKPTDRWQ